MNTLKKTQFGVFPSALIHSKSRNVLEISW